MESEKVKVSLFKDYMIVSTGYPPNSARELTQLINVLSNVSGYTIKKIAIHNIKYLGVTLTWQVNDLMINFQSLKKEI